MRHILFIAVLYLTACSLAPDYKRPEMAKVPDSYKENKGWVEANPADAVPRGEWWKIYSDPELDQLEAKVESANQNLKAAIARYQEARAAVRVARADYFPTLTADAGVSRQRVSSNIARYSPIQLYNDNIIGAEFSYEVDLWGRVQNEVTGAKARSKASAADLEGMDLSMHAELASDYFMLRGDDAAQKILDEAVVDYKKALDLTKDRYKGGAVSAIDVDQAETQYENTKTAAADNHLKRSELEHAIAVLIGEMPSNFQLAPAPLVAKPPIIDTGLPSTLLERRPDIAAAERRAAAANADIGVARAAWFPDLTLSAGAGVESQLFSNLVSAPSRFWSLGPSAAQTLFDGGKISGQTEEARQAFNEAVANYRQTVLTAYKEVEDNLVALSQLEQESVTQAAATAAAERALAQENDRYHGGIITYLDVVLAQNIALQAELASVDILTRRMVANVQLVRAIGGGLPIQKH